MHYDVVLTTSGPNKIQVIKAVREHTALGLKEAKDLVEQAPCTIRQDMPHQQATALLAALSGAGAGARLIERWDHEAKGGRPMPSREIIIKNTHRGLRYTDGVFTALLEAGRYVIPRPLNLGFYRRPKVEITLVDVRERDLTIKGQEILTADKVAIRVSIIVQFRVVDPRLALEAVENYETRIYTDVQLAARRSLAATSLEEILTDRNRLSEDILRDVKETAAGYGVAILRADVKDLIFPGNLQDIMNRVLAAERTSQAQLVDARTKAEMQRIDAQAKSDIKRAEAMAQAEARRRAAETESEVQRIQTEAEIAALRAREQTAQAYAEHPALLRLIELESLSAMAKVASARIYINFDGYAPAGKNGMGEKDDE